MKERFPGRSTGSYSILKVVREDMIHNLTQLTSFSGFLQIELLHNKGKGRRRGLSASMAPFPLLDWDCAYLRRSRVVLQSSPRAGSLPEHRDQPPELWRPVHLEAREQPGQLHEAGNHGQARLRRHLCFVQIEMNGLTGKIKFDQRGQRSDFELDIIELKRDGLTRVRNI